MMGGRSSLSPQRGTGTKSPNFNKQGRASPNYGAK